MEKREKVVGSFMERMRGPCIRIGDARMSQQEQSLAYLEVETLEARQHPDGSYRVSI